jgi:hypothetical protein
MAKFLQREMKKTRNRSLTGRFTDRCWAHLVVEFQKMLQVRLRIGGRRAALNKVVRQCS